MTWRREGRAAPAAALSMAKPSVACRVPQARLQRQLNAAVASANRATILALALRLDGCNNLGCPIDDNRN